MGDLIATAHAVLDRIRKASMASEVIYRRGADAVTLQATIGQTDLSVGDQLSVSIQVPTLDVLITASDLPWSEPEAGDHVEIGSTTYEVMDLIGQGVWRWSGPPGTTYRIHLKQVS